MDLDASGESIVATANQPNPSAAVGIPAILEYGLERTRSHEKKLLMSQKVGGGRSVRYRDKISPADERPVDSRYSLLSL